jgi:hypothetical protein
MTQPEARAAAVIGEPIPTSEIPLQERGERVFAMIDAFRQVLWATPEFGESLAVNYLSAFDGDNKDFIKDKISFERRRTLYMVRYDGSTQDLPNSGGLEIKQNLVVDTRENGNSQRTVLNAVSIGENITSAIANHIDGWRKESSTENLNKPEAFDEMAEVLQKLIQPARKRTSPQTTTVR